MAGPGGDAESPPGPFLLVQIPKSSSSPPLLLLFSSISLHRSILLLLPLSSQLPLTAALPAVSYTASLHCLESRSTSATCFFLLLLLLLHTLFPPLDSASAPPSTSPSAPSSSSPSSFFIPQNHRHRPATLPSNTAANSVVLPHLLLYAQVRSMYCIACLDGLSTVSVPPSHPQSSTMWCASCHPSPLIRPA